MRLVYPEDDMPTAWGERGPGYPWAQKLPFRLLSCKSWPYLSILPPKNYAMCIVWLTSSSLSLLTRDLADGLCALELDIDEDEASFDVAKASEIRSAAMRILNLCVGNPGRGAPNQGGVLAGIGMYHSLQPILDRCLLFYFYKLLAIGDHDIFWQCCSVTNSVLLKATKEHWLWLFYVISQRSNAMDPDIRP